MVKTSERLLNIIKKRNITYRELSDITGFASSAIHRYASGDTSRLDISRLQALARALDVSPLYLMGWSDEEQDGHSNKFIQIPKVAAQLSAGWGSYENGDEVEEYYSFRSDWLRAKGNPKSMVLMEVVGDSMEPIIVNGDMVMIDRDKTDLMPNVIYAVRVEDLIYLKYIDREPGKFILRSRNKFYEPMRLDTGYFTDNSVAILGRVIWWCHDELAARVG